MWRIYVVRQYFMNCELWIMNFMNCILPKLIATFEKKTWNTILHFPGIGSRSVYVSKAHTKEYRRRHTFLEATFVPERGRGRERGQTERRGNAKDTRTEREKKWNERVVSRNHRLLFDWVKMRPQMARETFVIHPRIILLCCGTNSRVPRDDVNTLMIKTGLVFATRNAI